MGLLLFLGPLLVLMVTPCRAGQRPAEGRRGRRPPAGAGLLPWPFHPGIRAGRVPRVKDPAQPGPAPQASLRRGGPGRKLQAAAPAAPAVPAPAGAGVLSLPVPPGLHVLGRGDAAAGAVQPVIVEPVHVACGGGLEGGDGVPGALRPDQLGLVQAVVALGDRVVVTVPFRPDRGDRAGGLQPGGAGNRQVLGAPVAVKPNSV